MSIFDKYKAVSTNKVKELKKSEDSQLNDGRRADRIELQTGSNKIRLMPKHDIEEHFMVMRACHWIAIEVEGKDEPQRRTVPNGRIHGPLTIDPFEAYTNFVKERLTQPGSTAEDLEKVKNITAWGKGLAMSASWWAYASVVDNAGKMGPIQILDINRTLRDAINDGMIIEDESEAIETDPYTDPLTGRLLLVTYNPKGKKATDKYKASVSQKTIVKLTEEMLIKYDKMTPISQLPDLTYTLKDFEMGLEGIKYYDEAEGIELFEDDELQAKFEEIKEEFLNAGAKGKATSTSAKSTTKIAAKPTAKVNTKAAVVEDEDELSFDVEEGAGAEEEDDTAAEVDMFEGMSRAELVAYKAEKAYPIKLLKNDDDETMRAKLREYEASIAVEDEEATENIEEEADETPAVVSALEKKAAPTATKGKSAPSLQSIKDELAAKSKKSK